MKSSKKELLSLRTSDPVQRFLNKEARRFKTTPEIIAVFFLARRR